MANEVLARKVGMTRIFTQDGESVPVTVLSTEPCYVVQKKTVERDGYNAIQVGYDRARPNQIRSKAVLGHFQKAGSEIFRTLGEIRVEDSAPYEVGKPVGDDLFGEGDIVNVVGISKGKGFAGVMKRHNFAGQGASHGQTMHRRPGSIGMNARPGHVLKNRKMPGHLGVDRTTVKNLRVVGVEKDLGVTLVKGAVPGGRGSLVRIRLVRKAS